MKSFDTLNNSDIKNDGSYVIKQASPADVDEIIIFYNKYLVFFNGISSKEELKGRITNNKGIFLIAREKINNKIIGIKLGYIDDGICLGRGIAVDKNWRRKEVASNLLKIFEKILKDNGNIIKYIFGSSSETGIPFHLAMGYEPTVFIQFNNRDIRNKLNFENFRIMEEKFNENYKVYQISLVPIDSSLDYKYLLQLKNKYPELNIQYVFSKMVSEMK